MSYHRFISCYQRLRASSHDTSRTQLPGRPTQLTERHLAVGSHQPPVRKLDSQLVGRAVVVVEDVRTALSEAGDVVLAIAEGQLRDDELIPMAPTRTWFVAQSGTQLVAS